VGELDCVSLNKEGGDAMRPVDDANAGSSDLPAKPLEVETYREGDSMTIAVSGELDLATVHRLDAAIRRAEETEVGRIVLDLSALSFLDSTGLSVLLNASVRNRGDGNRLTFIPSKHDAVQRLIALTDTAEMFE
jgi:anti-anti-sigma factor